MKERDQWTSKLGFILAAAGSAVGLGNIWKFPGKAFAGGGGAYLVIYLLVVIFIGFPVMVTELSVGRKTQANTLDAYRKLDKRFTWVGFFGILVAFIIFCYYIHVGGWVLRYVFSYLFEGEKVMADGLSYFYGQLGYDAATGQTWFPWAFVLFGAAFALLNAVILIKGVSGGIEKFNKVAMPALFIILIVLLVRSVTLPGSSEGLAYMFSFDTSKVNSSTFISALGQAFYSLSLGMAIMTTYGSYLSKDEHINKTSGIICTLDTSVAFLAGFIVVPAVFATLGSENIGKGGGFAFAALPGVFKAMPGGFIFGALFFLLLFFAALSSCISIGEGLIAFAVEQWGFERKKATIGIITICFLIGIVYTISQASVEIKLPWLDFQGITMVGAGDWMEYFTDRLLLPVCAFGECLFVGWFWKPQNVIDEIESSGTKFSFAKIYTFLIKYVCPAAILVIVLVSMITGQTIS